jgi:hypothetical protein
MAWDATRKVPWKRLLIEWLVVGIVFVVVSTAVFHNQQAETLVAIGLGGSFYLALGAVMAKFGYQRARLSDLRAQTAARQQAARQTPTRPSGRARPAPTKRTGGQSRHPRNKPRR